MTLLTLAAGAFPIYTAPNLSAVAWWSQILSAGRAITSEDQCTSNQALPCHEIKGHPSVQHVAGLPTFWNLVADNAQYIDISQWHCCDRKSRAACAQSFALWQQATIEFTCHDHSPRMLVVTCNRSHARVIRDYTPRSLYYCLFAPHLCMVLFFTHIPFVVNHTINATPPEKLQQHKTSHNQTLPWF